MLWAMSVESGPVGRVNRVPVTFRVSPVRRGWLDETARFHNTDVAVVVRAALAVAARHPDEFADTIDAAG